MACGTGKTLTAIRIVEEVTPKTDSVLFLAPSLALISQTLRAFAYQAKEKQEYLAVCSDSKVGRNEEGEYINDLQIPVTTDTLKIKTVLKNHTGKRLIVFCTYQSLIKVKEAQEDLAVPDFNLTLCDEAHRTISH